MHSHLPVRHLIRQVESYAARRAQRDIRPEWLTTIINAVAEQFEPLVDLGRVGFDCQLNDQGWHVDLFLGRLEVVGGPEDGVARNLNFQMELLPILKLYDEVHRCVWSALPDVQSAEEEGQPEHSFVEISGLTNGQQMTLRLLGQPPRNRQPGLRQYPDGTHHPA